MPPTTCESAPGPARPQRWLALDLFRAFAVVSMIQGHTFTALLQPSHYSGTWSRWHTLVHGLTAPMFLLGGGLAYGLVSFTRRASARAGGIDRGVRRAFSLVLIGTFLQLPGAPLSRVFADRALLQALLGPGALQLVAACLLLSAGLRRVTATRRQFALCAGVLCAFISGTAPFAWKARWSSEFLLGTWLDGRGPRSGAQFPLMPWMAFFLLGTIVAGVAAEPLRQRRAAARWLGAVGLLLAGGSYLAYVRGVTLDSIYGQHAFWSSNPLFTAFRAGLVLSWLSLLCRFEARIASLWRLLPWAAGLSALLSRRSLVAYVVHLMLLYGSPVSRGLVRMGRTLNISEALLAFAYVFGTTVFVTACWDRFVASGALQARVQAGAALLGGLARSRVLRR